MLTPDPFPYRIDPGFEFVRQYGNKYLFRNKEALPFGLFFTQYLPEADFLRLTTSEREKEKSNRERRGPGREGVAPRRGYDSR